MARAEAEKIRKIGAAEAHAIELVGKAEAERMRMKAHVYKQYGDAAIMNIVLESLPKVLTILYLHCLNSFCFKLHIFPIDCRRSSCTFGKN